MVLFLVVSCARAQVPGKTVSRPRDPNTVSFQSSAAQYGGIANLAGRLKKPDGSGPFPAVVLLHGCGGMQPGRDNAWAERLSGWGYATLQVDSFRPRGLSSVCTYSGREATDILQQRVTDAYDAKRYLAGLSFVDRRRIAVMGWSHGGATTLETVYTKTDDPFHAVAFYPSCRRMLTGLNAPLLILIGEADDWTSAARCGEMMPKEQAAPEVLLKVYPGAHHAFDSTGASRDVAGSRGSLHHLEHHPGAAADSILRTRAFLEKYLK
jgi:dienelactone hydrolase